MKLFVDTANIAEIKELASMGVIDASQGPTRWRLESVSTFGVLRDETSTARMVRVTDPDRWIHPQRDLPIDFPRRVQAAFFLTQMLLKPPLGDIRRLLQGAGFFK